MKFFKSSKKFELLPVGVTNEAIKVSKNLSSTWLDMSYDQKHELQHLYFPRERLITRKMPEFELLKHIYYLS
jgi:hypothetical protein